MDRPKWANTGEIRRFGIGLISVDLRRLQTYPVILSIDHRVHCTVLALFIWVVAKLTRDAEKEHAILNTRECH